MKMTKTHKLLTVDEFRSDATAGSLLTKTSYCPDHPSPTVLHELTLCCRTCDHKPICRDCIVVQHKDHDYDFLASMASEIKKAIVGLVAAIEKRTVPVSKAADDLATLRQAVLERQISAKKEIQGAAQIVLAALHEREKTALEAVDTATSVKLKRLSAQEEALGSFLASIKSSTEYAKTTLRAGSDAQILLSRPTLARRLIELQQQQCVLAPTATIDLWVSADTTPITTAFGSFCSCFVPTL